MTLIDKDALLEKLSTFHPDYTFNITSFRNFIKAQPEVEKKGKWIADVDRWGDVVTTVNGYICSECKVFNTDKDNFCPNCGARMEKEK